MSEPRRKHSPQSYGDLTRFSVHPLIRDAVGQGALAEIADDYLDLLETSAAIYERNGDYALGLFTSGWCRTLDSASRAGCGADDNREALRCGRWHCHESCWSTSKASIEQAREVDLPCLGGIRIFAVPIVADGEVVGSINVGYGSPPAQSSELAELAERYGLPVETLRQAAAAYTARTPETIEVAKQRLRASARLIGALVAYKRAEGRRFELERRVYDLEKLDGIAGQKRIELIAMLAGGVAHAINTPLQYMRSNVEFLREALASLREHAERCERAAPDLVLLLPELAPALEQSEAGLSQMASAVAALREFGREGSSTRAVFDLNERIRSVLGLFQSGWEQAASLDVELSEDLYVQGFAGEVGHVVLDWLMGAVRVIGAAASGEPALVRIRSRVVQCWAELEIFDSGPSLELVPRSRIAAQGSLDVLGNGARGRSLEIAYHSIVDRQSGALDCRSERGQGTTLRIRLPLVDRVGRGPEGGSAVPIRQPARRIVVSIPVAIEVGSLCDEGEICDLSSSGARIEGTHVALAVGSRIRLTFALSLGDSSREIWARVVRPTGRGYAVEFDGSLSPL